MTSSRTQTTHVLGPIVGLTLIAALSCQHPVATAPDERARASNADHTRFPHLPYAVVTGEMRSGARVQVRGRIHDRVHLDVTAKWPSLPP